MQAIKQNKHLEQTVSQMKDMMTGYLALRNLTMALCLRNQKETLSQMLEMSNLCIVVVRLDSRGKSRCSLTNLDIGKRVQADEQQNNKKIKVQTRIHNSLR